MKNGWCGGKINLMVITLISGGGVKCQVGDFSLTVDPQRTKAGNLTLRTETKLPVESFPGAEIIQGPGEYEISGAKIRGVLLTEETNSTYFRTLYEVELDGIRAAFMNNLNALPSSETLDRLGEIDILFLSVNQAKIKTKEAVVLIKQIDPKVIIPIDEKLMKGLAEELGQKVKAEEKLVVKRRDFLKEESSGKLVWLSQK